MQLLTVGDSFTYGEELSDPTSAWPIVLGTKLGYTINNMAKPGSGNSRMVRYVVENCKDSELIIIAWSHFARTEVADENGFYDLWPGCSPIPHKQHSPWRSDLIEYYSRHHNDDYLYRQHLLNVILLQSYLNKNNKRYLMLNTFGNHQYRKQSSHLDLLNQIDSAYFVGGLNQSMMEWTYGCEQGPNGHFLDKGHLKVAERIYQHMEQLVWVN